MAGDKALLDNAGNADAACRIFIRGSAAGQAFYRVRTAFM